MKYSINNTDNKARKERIQDKNLTALLVMSAMYSGIILWMHPANERWRYIVTLSLIGWVHTQNDPCVVGILLCYYLFCLTHSTFGQQLSKLQMPSLT